MLISRTDEAPSDREYHRVRAKQELNRARFAGSTCARSAHLELARLHTERVNSEGELSQRGWRLGPGSEQSIEPRLP
jgi:hypothetical protein